MKKLLLALLLAAPLAHAQTYRVDLIVFLDKSAPNEQGNAPQAASLSRALELSNAPALAASGIRLLPEEDFALGGEWQKLKNAKRYEPLLKLAWTQKDPPSEKGVALHLKSGESFAVSDGALGSLVTAPVDGTVTLLGGQYLHLQADLAYTTRSEDGARAWRLAERRRLRRDELHYLDSPRLGLLVRVVKV